MAIRKKIFLCSFFLCIFLYGISNIRASCYKYCYENDIYNCIYVSSDGDPVIDHQCWIWGFEKKENGSTVAKFEYGTSKASVHCPDGVSGDCALTTLDKCKGTAPSDISYKVPDKYAYVYCHEKPEIESGFNYDPNSLVNCGNHLLSDIPVVIPKTIHRVYLFLEIIIPLILIIFGSIDFVKALIAQKDDEIKKGQQTFLKRIIVGIIIFFVFSIVKVVISVVADSDKSINIIDCASCLINNDEKCEVE